jgi:hypothetical protein
MSELDKYAAIADRYSQMIERNLNRERFFTTVFDRFHIRSVLDCSCGTGCDLLLFHSLGHHVVGWTYPDFVDTLLRCGLPQRILFVLGRRSVAQVRV